MVSVAIQLKSLRSHSETQESKLLTARVRYNGSIARLKQLAECATKLCMRFSSPVLALNESKSIAPDPSPAVAAMTWSE